MKIFQFLFILFWPLSNSFGQNPWTQLASFPPETRSSASIFTLNNKIYVCGGAGPNIGSYSRKDLWEYDPATGLWTRKADFPGEPRLHAVGFNLNGKGYFGLGEGTINQLNSPFNDFYSYDQSSDSWTRLADYPFPNHVSGPVFFGLNNTGYVGGGLYTINYIIYRTNSFYQFDPTTNTWTAKANMPDALESAVGFSENGKGYVGLGKNGSTNPIKFYEYDPVTNTWLYKTDFPGGWRAGATGISSSSKGYLEAGTNSSYQKDFWEYDSEANSWKRLSDDPGGVRADAVGIYLNGNIYLGIGASKSDWWRYAPACDIVVSQISGSPAVCSTNTFTLQSYPVGANISWSATPTNLFQGATSGMGSSSLLSRAPGASGLATITFNITGPCTYSISKSISIGAPAPSYIAIDNTSCPEYYFSTNSVLTATSYLWQYNQLPSGPITSFTTTVPQTGRRVLNSGYSYRIGVQANCTCGPSYFTTTQFTVNCPHAPLVTASPNPVTNILTVQLNPSINTNPLLTYSTDAIGSVVLKDGQGNTVAESYVKSSKINLSIAFVPKGTYYLFVMVGVQEDVQRIIVDR
jgi:N-acetylneuraminic acid mutarotase